MTDTEYVRSITKLTDRDQQLLAGHYAKLRPEERIAVHGLQTGISQKLKGRKAKSHAPAFYHATFLLAVREYRMAQNPRLSKRMTRKEAVEIDGLQAVHANAKKHRKASAARALVEEKYGLIAMLRDRDESWRSIAAKLSGEDVTVSHTGLKSIFERLGANGGV
ncbi:MAG: hypothetical protein ABSD38_10625 [Syntrophorhabdales bacterium]|jgi:hypothetical protein